jgi:hypothetical protein
MKNILFISEIILYFEPQSAFMMQEKDIYSELSSIRNLMERSTKFISLSGLSGIMAGVYALIGAYFGYKLVYGNSTTLDYRQSYVNTADILAPLFMIAAAVLVLSLLTGIWLTIRQAKKKNEQTTGNHYGYPAGNRRILYPNHDCTRGVRHHLPCLSAFLWPGPDCRWAVYLYRC